MRSVFNNKMRKLDGGFEIQCGELIFINGENRENIRNVKLVENELTENYYRSGITYELNIVGLAISDTGRLVICNTLELGRLLIGLILWHLNLGENTNRSIQYSKFARKILKECHGKFY